MLFIRRSVSFSFCWLACVIRMQVVGEEERDAQNTNTGDCTTRQPNSRRSEEFKIAVYDGTAFWRCCCDEKSFLPFILRLSLSLSLSRFLLLPFPFLDCEGSRASNTEAVQLVAFRWSWILLTLLRRLRGGRAGTGTMWDPYFPDNTNSTSSTSWLDGSMDGQGFSIAQFSSSKGVAVCCANPLGRY